MKKNPNLKSKFSIVGPAPKKGRYPFAEPKGRQELKLGKDRVIRHLGKHTRRVIIGVPTLGLIRIEWDVHRRGQIIPINWQCGEITASHMPASVFSEGYHTADAQNTIIERAVLDGYEWVLLWEDDVLPPFDALMRMNLLMEQMTAPIVSGLYYSKGEPTWPLVFRGRGNGAFRNFALGEYVWADGVPTGFLMIHKSIFNYMWANSPEYKLPDGRKCRQMFKFPRDSWYDPEQDRYFAQMGTSDLHFCDRLMKEKVFRKTGWTKLSREPFPFLVDTNIFCQQIDHNGKYYPAGCRQILPPLKDLRRAVKAAS